MKEWIKGMLSSDSANSSNRFYAGIIALSVIALAFLSLILGKSLQEAILYTLGGMFAVCITGAVASKFSGQ